MTSESESPVNIGPKLATDLRQVGVPDVETLRRIGAPEAARCLAVAGLRDCAHAQRALEGALAGVRWTMRERQNGWGRTRCLFARSVRETAIDRAWLQLVYGKSVTIASQR